MDGAPVEEATRAERVRTQRRLAAIDQFVCDHEALHMLRPQPLRHGDLLPAFCAAQETGAAYTEAVWHAFQLRFGSEKPVYMAPGLQTAFEQALGVTSGAP